VAQLDFEKPDWQRFPCLKLAYAALREAGTAPAILNAANESAVEMFLNNSLAYNEIPGVIEYALEKIESVDVDSLETVLDADRRARAHAHEFMSRT
jgi:1-deoxy-D-xylulose-5-phosphate reductoisomerase